VTLARGPRLGEHGDAMVNRLIALGLDAASIIPPAWLLQPPP